MRKKRKEDEQTLEESNSAHRRSQAKCQLLQTSYIKRIKSAFFRDRVSGGTWSKK